MLHAATAASVSRNLCTSNSNNRRSLAAGFPKPPSRSATFREFCERVARTAASFTRFAIRAKRYVTGRLFAVVLRWLAAIFGKRYFNKRFYFRNLAGFTKNAHEREFTNGNDTQSRGNIRIIS